MSKFMIDFGYHVLVVLCADLILYIGYIYTTY